MALVEDMNRSLPVYDPPSLDPYASLWVTFISDFRTLPDPETCSKLHVRLYRLNRHRQRSLQQGPLAYSRSSPCFRQTTQVMHLFKLFMAGLFHGACIYLFRILEPIASLASLPSLSKTPGESALRILYMAMYVSKIRYVFFCSRRASRPVLPGLTSNGCAEICLRRFGRDRSFSPV